MVVKLCKIVECYKIIPSGRKPDGFLVLKKM